MNNDPASLENLRDIVVPPPVPWWPPAPGWWIVFAMLLVTVAVFGFRAWRSWHANAYRRQALRELRGVTSVAKIAEILKRTALGAYPRTDVASLSGTAWCQWLEETGGRPVPENVEPSTDARSLCQTGECERSRSQSVRCRVDQPP